MSIVILGGNECMERRYMDLCQSYRCRAKVFIKPVGGLKNKLGDPDLTIFYQYHVSQNGPERPAGAEELRHGH